MYRLTVVDTITDLIQLIGSDWNVIMGYVPEDSAKLLAIFYEQLIGTGKVGELVSDNIPDIYINLT